MATHGLPQQVHRCVGQGVLLCLGDCLQLGNVVVAGADPSTDLSAKVLARNPLPSEGFLSISTCRQCCLVHLQTSPHLDTLMSAGCAAESAGQGLAAVLVVVGVVLGVQWGLPFMVAGRAGVVLLAFLVSW